MAVFNVSDGVAHRLNEAIDQRSTKRGARRRLNATSRYEAVFQRMQKLLRPMCAALCGLRFCQCAGHAYVHVGKPALVTLGVFFEQYFFADCLCCQRRGRVNGG